MIPFLIFGGLAGVIAWAIRPKDTGAGMGYLPPMYVLGEQKFSDSKTGPGFMGPPLQPEEERLLTLLTLWVKDKKYPAGKKRYMTKALAVEAAKLAARLKLMQTARALLTDGPVPTTERMGRRGVTIREAILIWNAKN